MTQQKLLTPEEIAAYSQAYDEQQRTAHVWTSQALAGRLATFWQATADKWEQDAHKAHIPTHEVSKAKASRAITALWNTFYYDELSTDERREIAADFIERWLTTPYLRKITVVHPSTRKATKPEGMQQVVITDVLGDFIIRSLQADESSELYPVQNADKAVRGTRRQRYIEMPLLMQSEMDRLDALGRPYTPREMPETALHQEAKVEIEYSTPDAAEFISELENVKANAEKWAGYFSDRHGYDKRTTIRGIKRLDMARVVECEVCGNAFYQHDLRQVYCNTQHTRGKRSACQRVAERKAS